jgi:mono/diheme cytochrome c family protein
VKLPAQRILVAAVLVAAVALGSGCDSDGLQVKSRGAVLFSERCSGCHTLTPAGARGSISGEPPTGPNLDKRKLTKQEALFAIRNGGFSGAIMPQNVVVGKDAEAVADFLAKYAGQDAKSPPSPTQTGSTQTTR